MAVYPCEQYGREIGYKGVCYQCKIKNEQDKFLNLSDEQIEEKIKNIVQNIEQMQNYGEAYNEFWGLFTLRGISDERIARAALKAEIYHPHQLYYKAPSDVRDELLRLLDERPSCANDLLLALAMQGDEKTLQAFVEFEKYPKEWRKGLYVGPAIYAQSGGWTFDTSGERRSLVFEKCLILKECESGCENEPVKIAQRTGEKCEFCGCEMIDAISIKADEPSLEFLNLKRDMRMRCCPNCVAFSTFTCENFAGGNVKTSFDRTQLEKIGVQNYINEDTMNEIVSHKFRLDRAPKPSFYPCFAESDISIGGHGDWVQDAEYCECPKCGKTMKLLAQIPWSLIDGGEGILYVEICPECYVLSAFHQQT